MPDLNDFKDKRGKFIKGNPGGPGNPFASRQQEYRELFLKCVTQAKFKKIIKKITEKAIKGDLSAAKLLFERICGKLPEGTSISVANGKDGNSIISIKVDDGNSAG
jgi:hypothetical protein